MFFVLQCWEGRPLTGSYPEEMTCGQPGTLTHQTFSLYSPVVWK